MGSSLAAHRSSLTRFRKAARANESLFPTNHVAMTGDQLPIIPRAGPRPNAVNAARHIPRRTAPPPEACIEISSSSSSASYDGEAVENEEDAQLEPHKHRTIEPQEPLAASSPTPEPNLFLSSPKQPAHALGQPVAHNSQNAARDQDEVNPVVWNDFTMGDNEMVGGRRFYGLDDLENFDAINDFDLFPFDLQRGGPAHVTEKEYRARMAPQRHEDNQPVATNPQAIERPPIAMDTKAACVNMVLMIFPDICDEHVSNLYDTISKDADGLVAHILENVEKGKPYAKAKEAKKTLKRKREVDEDEEAILKYAAGDRPANVSPNLQRYIGGILRMEFADTPVTFIETCLRQNKYHVFSTYRVLEEAERTYDIQNPPYNKIKAKRKMLDEYREANLQTSITNVPDERCRNILLELQAARRIRKKADSKRREERRLELEEENNLLKAQAEGTMMDCQCCFGDYPINRMVHCDSEEDLHWFCRGCARRNAETVIGQSKYQLVCMAMEDCTFSFSMAQRSNFLDEKTTIALERNEQEANLRMAGIENLASCPFCPYAAEYPPVEIDREFRCEAPDCEKVSCRLCKLESHIPKSCEENAKYIGLSVRRQVEEAMSEALIRKCNQCGTPFVKDEGCNKMACTRSGCHNVQCYVCSKSCTYAHFNDETRGGKAGNCPLFEKTSERHDEEVKKAEKEALDKIRADHPEYTEEDLKVKVSDAVLQDEQRWRAEEGAPHLAGYARYHAPFIPRPDGFNDEINNYLAFGHPGLAQEAFVELNRDLQRQVHQLPVFRAKADNDMALPRPLEGQPLGIQDPYIKKPDAPRAALRHAAPGVAARPAFAPAGAYHPPAIQQWPGAARQAAEVKRPARQARPPPA